jgi:hypothetical protein
MNNLMPAICGIEVDRYRQTKRNTTYGGINNDWLLPLRQGDESLLYASR